MEFNSVMRRQILASAKNWKASVTQHPFSNITNSDTCSRITVSLKRLKAKKPRTSRTVLTKSLFLVAIISWQLRAPLPFQTPCRIPIILSYGIQGGKDYKDRVQRREKTNKTKNIRSHCCSSICDQKKTLVMFCLRQSDKHIVQLKVKP